MGGSPILIRTSYGLRRKKDKTRRTANEQNSFRGGWPSCSQRSGNAGLSSLIHTRPSLRWEKPQNSPRKCKLFYCSHRAEGPGTPRADVISWEPSPPPPVMLSRGPCPHQKRSRARAEGQTHGTRLQLHRWVTDEACPPHSGQGWDLVPAHGDSRLLLPPAEGTLGVSGRQAPPAPPATGILL